MVTFHGIYIRWHKSTDVSARPSPEDAWGRPTEFLSKNSQMCHVLFMKCNLIYSKPFFKHDTHGRTDITQNSLYKPISPATSSRESSWIFTAWHDSYWTFCYDYCTICEGNNQVGEFKHSSFCWLRSHHWEQELYPRCLERRKLRISWKDGNSGCPFMYLQSPSLCHLIVWTPPKSFWSPGPSCKVEGARLQGATPDLSLMSKPNAFFSWVCLS